MDNLSKEFKEQIHVLVKERFQFKSKVERLPDLFSYCFEQLGVNLDKMLKAIKEEIKGESIMYSKKNEILR